MEFRDIYKNSAAWREIPQAKKIVGLNNDRLQNCTQWYI